MAEFGVRFHIYRYRKFSLMSILSIPDESPCWKTSTYKFSAHSDVSATNGTSLTYNQAPLPSLLACSFLSPYFGESTSNQPEIFTINYCHQDLHTGKIASQNSNFYFFSCSCRGVRGCSIVNRWEATISI
jgi:hypothetical protein